MALALITPAVLAGALAAAAIALAPMASAEDRRGGGCDKGRGCSAPAQPAPKKNPLSSDFTADLPKGWTNEALWARPGGSNPFGKGPKPPILALD